MWLVLCFPHDTSAQWAAAGLERRGVVPLEAVSPDALVCSRQIVHHIVRGQARTTFSLPDGRLIDSDVVRGALNRVTALPLTHLASAVADDRRYAEQELHALVLSVLHGLGDRIINRPSPRGLAGSLRSAVEWLCLAGRAGFRTAAYCEGNPDRSNTSGLPDGALRRAIVLDDRVHGSTIPPQVVACAISLARLADTRLLGVDLVESPRGDWWFGAASVVPNLRIGGEPFLDALALALTGTRR